MAATMKLAFSPLHATASVTARAPCCSAYRMGALPQASQLSTRCCATQLSTTAPACQDVQSVFKVFADDNAGIVCYKNEHDEMVCEGLDEGPYFYPQSSSKDGSFSMYVPENQAAQIVPIFEQLMYEI